MKGGVKVEKRASFGKIVRKRLSDITNISQAANRSPIEDPKTLLFSSGSEITRGYVDELIQKNRALVELIEERNKIIELSGAELQRLRISYQKTQHQNWNLAKSNSQMLAELNLARDKLKVLRHELACKEALHKAKKLEVEENVVKKHVVKNGWMEMEGEEMKKDEVAKEGLHKANDKQKPPGGRRRQHQRSQSMGAPGTNRQELEKEKIENKRRCLRRQSVRFLSLDGEPAENLFEIEEAKFPISRPRHSESGPSFSDPLKENDAPSRADEQEAQRRSSISRPLRRAAEKVQTYKEPPLNIKMRRVD
ncbi:hypothetical protein SAY87_016618 [Trapa incisa]|uniref:Shugoshin C-terminal domain-containing protein n=1 Tax=Trapa incisa TaxID=236973 RepID=A0AAN7QVI3_9MYRT|nr:hypothetical protein SAY87_016618 [Trapa incisa]